MRRATFTECQRLDFNEAKHDPETGVFRNVSVCGRQSTNGRKYTERALESAVPVYEGAAVRINHAKGPRNVRDRFGTLRAVRYENGKLRGDLHYFKAHPDAGWLGEAFDAQCRDIGLSHDALCEFRNGADGNPEITSIRRVRSVDVVDTPATNSSFTEQDDMATTLKEFVEGLAATAPARATLDPFAAEFPGLELSFAEGDSEEQRIGFAMTAAIEEATAKNRLVALLQVPAPKAKPAPKNPSTPPAGGITADQLSEAVSAALKPVTQRLDSLAAENTARRVIEEAGGVATAENVAELMKLSGEKAMTEAVAKWSPSKLDPYNRPWLPAAQTTEQAGSAKAAGSIDEFVSSLR